MFGLIRPKKGCNHNSPDQNYYHHRLHYCGTCKSIGQQFGHKSRLLLNFDSVFLSELMSDLYQSSVNNWDETLQSANTCFDLPNKITQLPFELAYPATASVLLGILKIDDQIKDRSQLSWKLAKRVYSTAFQTAIAQFETWDIPTCAIYALVDKQIKREASKVRFENLEECLLYYSKPTADITSFIFEHAGKYIPPKKNKLADIGLLFGQLVYTLDAFEDYEKDMFNKEFNPLAVFWGRNRSLDASQLEAVRTILLQLQEKLCSAFAELPINIERINIYQERLRSNIALRIYKERIIPQTFIERLQQRWVFAKSFAAEVNCLPSRQLGYYVLVWAVFINPQTTTYLPQEGKLEILQWTTLITAVLGSLGIIGVIRKKSRKERKKEKRQRRRFRRFATKLKNIILRKNNCWANCADSNCCQNCSEGCCKSCGEAIANSENPWVWIVIFACILLIAGIVLLILLLMGII